MTRRFFIKNYLKFGFQKHFSTAHAIINLIDSIQKAINNRLLVCEFFIELQNVCDTVGHKILLHKRSHHQPILFSFYLSSITQLFTIKVFNSETQSLRYKVPQSSVLGSLLFLIYINDLYNPIHFFPALCFADEICLLSIQRKIFKINKGLKKYLKELSFWLNKNKIILNVCKDRAHTFPS